MNRDRDGVTPRWVVGGVVAVLAALVEAPALGREVQPAPTAEVVATDDSEERTGGEFKSRADDWFAQGVEFEQQGRVDDAIKAWERARQGYETNPAGAAGVQGRIQVLQRLAGACQQVGQWPLAVQYLQQAGALAEQADDRASLTRVYDALGAVYILMGDTALAQPYLEKSLAMATELGDVVAQASVWNNTANGLAAAGRYAQAVKLYDSCLAIAQRTGQTTLAVKATVNSALAAAAMGHAQQATQADQRAFDLALGLDDSHEKLLLLITIGRNETRLAKQGLASNPRLAFDSLDLATKIARQRGDQHALCHALGSLASLYRVGGDSASALQLNRQAVFFAQQSRSPDALYQWQWQSGRLLHALGRPDEAIQAYRRAATTYRSIRQDAGLALGNHRFGLSTASSAVGGMFSELADLLLQRAAAMGDRPSTQHLLHQARDAIEQHKSAELTDYFQDACVQQFQQAFTRIEEVAPHTAVVYLIPLPDRTELLLSFHDGLQRIRVDVPREQLVQQVHQFRRELEDVTTRRDLRHARQLDQWLIAPIESALRSRAVDTLVFVPDGALRLIPMAALHDGQRYLVQRYAVAVTPGLTLMDPKPLESTRARVLAGGLSVAAHEGFSALAHVPEELNNITDLFSSTMLLDQQFSSSRIQQEIRQQPYQIVHIASHGHFGRTADETYVLTYDTKLTLPGLEQLIRPSRFRHEPVELLTLSACETAAGDDRAALGMAGIAIKAGARSALATLWPIQDRAATALITDFYRRLRENPSLSKAKALQQAQVKMLEDWQHDDPYFWSPYLLIGNWL